MTRFIVARASLIGFAVTGVMAVASITPAWAQAQTHRDEADCAAIQGAAKRPECMRQLGQEQHGSSWFSQDFTIRVVPPDQSGFGLEGGGGVQSPVVPNNGALAPFREDAGSVIGTLRW
jgi:hypothetical protein